MLKLLHWPAKKISQATERLLVWTFTNHLASGQKVNFISCLLHSSSSSSGHSCLGAAPFNLIVFGKTLIMICAITHKQGQLLFVAWATEVWKERARYLNTVPHTFLDTLGQFSFSLNTRQNESTQRNFLVKFPVKVYNALNFPGYVDPCNTSNDQKSWEARYGFFQPIR